MAKVANPLIGKTSGSIGGVTFSSWKGVNVAKSKPTVVANPDSDPQKAQRSAFTQIINIYRLLVAIVGLGFKQLAVKQSPYNAFCSVNLKDAFDTSVPPTATFEPENLVISKGTIAKTAITSVSASEAAGDVDFNFPTSATGPGQSATDRPLMAVYNETQDEWAAAVGTATRTTGSDSLSVPATWVETDSLHCYLGFVNAEGSAAGDSDYKSAVMSA